MRFGQPYYLIAFWIIPVLLLFLIFAFKRKKRLLETFAQEGLVRQIAASVDHKKQRLKSVLVLLAVVFSILALMRPQWGFQWQEIKRRGVDILIAIDTSKSMLASDVKPDRLERAKLAVKDLLKKLQGDRIGLIAFSGTAFLQCPLTIDYDGFLLALDDLNVNTIPRGGTAISRAIEVALKSYEGGQNKYKVLVVITDGEDHEGDALEAAKKAAKENIKIFCIGIGTAAGELIQVPDQSAGKAFLKDAAGNVVKSRLNEDLLKQIAVATGGSYVHSSGAEFGLDLIYEERIATMEKREIKAQMAKLYHEHFQIPLTVAFLLLIMDTFITDRKKR